MIRIALLSSTVNSPRRLLTLTPQLCRRLHSSSSNSAASADEVERFSRLASEAADERGPLRALHSMNELRVPWIRDTLVTPAGAAVLQPLAGLRLADVGCGVGILSEPLARLGASVRAVDAADACVDVARARAAADARIADRLEYSVGTADDLLAEEGAFDAVVASEVVEHVDDRAAFVQTCGRLVRPGGSLFLTTLNRTVAARVLAIWLAEAVGVVPADLHDWRNFTSPAELAQLLDDAGCRVRLVSGLTLNPLTNRWYWIPTTLVNYAVHAVKHA